MTRIYDNEVNKISECNSLYDKINPCKRTKILNIHYSPIMHECINNRKGGANFKNFQIILDSGCISMIIVGRIVEKVHPEKDDVMQWHTQAGNITTNIKVEVDFTLPDISDMNVVTCKWYVDDYYKGRYDIIVGRYILT